MVSLDTPQTSDSSNVQPVAGSAEFAHIHPRPPAISQGQHCAGSLRASGKRASCTEPTGIQGCTRTRQAWNPADALRETGRLNAGHCRSSLQPSSTLSSKALSSPAFCIYSDPSDILFIDIERQGARPARSHTDPSLLGVESGLSEDANEEADVLSPLGVAPSSHSSLRASGCWHRRYQTRTSRSAAFRPTLQPEHLELLAMGLDARESSLQQLLAAAPGSPTQTMYVSAAGRVGPLDPVLGAAVRPGRFQPREDAAENKEAGEEEEGMGGLLQYWSLGS
ncbi:hypothetical protein QJQ45_026417 [Haematococcus lacustris]|nr:hypothetical protein QJQ45_026417 [Haematococcus lacustris]